MTESSLLWTAGFTLANHNAHDTRVESCPIRINSRTVPSNNDPCDALPHSQHPEKTFSIHPLVLGRSLGELERDTAASESLVNLRVGVEAVVDTTTLLLVKNDLEDLGVVLLGAEALADNLDGVDEIAEDGVVDGSQGARARALLLLGVASTGRAFGAGQDAARGEDDDVAVGERLLELTGQALLDAVETGQGGDGDKDDNSLLAVANLDLFKTLSQQASSRFITVLRSVCSLDRFPSYSMYILPERTPALSASRTSANIFFRCGSTSI